MSNSKKTSRKDEETLEELLIRLEIQPDEWDLLIIGDGSGSNWTRESGWASISIDRVTRERRVWVGSMNRGTVNFAEMMAYLQPLNWYASVELNKRKKSGNVRFRNVHIITDSKYCREQGSKKALLPKKNSVLWKMFDGFQRHGILLHWHWVPRDTVELNIYADKISKVARKAIEELQTKLETEDEKDRDVTLDSLPGPYRFNP